MSSLKRLLILTALAITAVAALPSTGEAQRFRGRRVVRAPVIVGGYYSPYWLYDPWFGFGYQYPWGPYPYPYPYGGYSVNPGAAIRLQIKPEKAEVYVDGYYAGIVDDFDGSFQRLRVRPGEHEIALYLDGYRSVRQKVLATPNNTFKLKYTMEPLGAGEQPDARPQPPNPPPGGPAQQAGPPPMGPPPGRGPGGRRMPQGPPPGAPMGQPPPGPPPIAGASRGEASVYGTLAIRVQPGDADVLIDGEAWRGPDAQDRLVIEVAEGSHTIEIRKAGYRAFVTQAQVRRSETTTINVSLRSQEDEQ